MSAVTLNICENILHLAISTKQLYIAPKWRCQLSFEHDALQAIKEKVKIKKVSVEELIIPIQSYTKDVTFQWTENPEPFANYKTLLQNRRQQCSSLRRCRPHRRQFSLIDKTTTYTVTRLSDSETYHFLLQPIIIPEKVDTQHQENRIRRVQLFRLIALQPKIQRCLTLF